MLLPGEVEIVSMPLAGSYLVGSFYSSHILLSRVLEAVVVSSYLGTCSCGSVEQSCITERLDVILKCKHFRVNLWNELHAGQPQSFTAQMHLRL